MGVVKFLTDMGLFIGQSPAFFAYLESSWRSKQMQLDAKTRIGIKGE